MFPMYINATPSYWSKLRPTIVIFVPPDMGPWFGEASTNAGKFDVPGSAAAENDRLLQIIE